MSKTDRWSLCVDLSDNITWVREGFLSFAPLTVGVHSSSRKNKGVIADRLLSLAENFLYENFQKALSR
jgi:hypothetical protein